MTCPARGKVEEGHITIHSQQERRYKCEVCGRTFSQTKGTAWYGIKKSTETFVIVVTLLAYGCPVQAIVMAFGLDERNAGTDGVDGAGDNGQHPPVVGRRNQPAT